MSKLIINNNYGIAPNELLNDKELSLKAKGLFTYLQSKPDNWNFSTGRIASQIKESQKTIRTTLQELEKFGLLKRNIKPKDDRGKWTGYEYILYNTIGKNPSYPKGVVPKIGSTEKGKDISNKYYSNKEIVKKNIEIAKKKLNKLLITNNNQKKIPKELQKELLKEPKKIPKEPSKYGKELAKKMQKKYQIKYIKWKI